jgi:anti-anti-sigma regulatory factor
MLTITEGEGALELAGELDIYAVRDARARLVGVSAIDLSAVDVLDGAGVQLLAWWRAQDPARRVVKPSPAVGLACAALGLSGLLGAA